MGIKLRHILGLLLLAVGLSISAQDQKQNYHTVEAGETIYGISREYNISMEDLKRFNPDIENGLKVGMKLLIPIPAEQSNTQMEQIAEKGFTYHNVQAEETLYSLAKEYGATIESIKVHNAFLTDGLKVGQTLKIPIHQTDKEQDTQVDPNFYYHTVISGETAYSLSQTYQISLDSLYLLNPTAKDGLKINQELKLPINRKPASLVVEKSTITDGLVNDDNEPLIETPKLELDSVKTEDSSSYFLYQVKAGDSFFSLEKKFSVNRKELISYNPELTSGLEVDKYIIVPNKQKKEDTGWLDKLFTKVEPEDPIVSVSDKDIVKKNLLNKPNDQTNELVIIEDTLEIDFNKNYSVGLLLPFSAEFAYVDTSGDFSDDIELPMHSQIALDFYNGFLIAVDTLTKKGMHLSLQVYDTEKSLFKTKELSNTLKTNNLDLVIGPLYRENVEYVAKSLEEQMTPVVSPLSKSVSVKGFPNLIQSIPDNSANADCIADLINRDFATDRVIFAYSTAAEEVELVKQIRARLLPRDSNASFISEILLTEETLSRYELREMLAYDKKNVVVVATENPVFLSDVVNNLRRLRDTSIHLVGSAKLLQINTLEMSYLNNLHLITPDVSHTDYQDSVTQMFIAKYRSKYGVEPSRFAHQGYDIAMFYLRKLWKTGPYFKFSLDSNTPEALTFMGFKFRKSKDGGYLNEFMYLKAIKDYTLVRIR